MGVHVRPASMNHRHHHHCQSITANNYHCPSAHPSFNDDHYNCQFDHHHHSHHLHNYQRHNLFHYNNHDPHHHVQIIRIIMISQTSESFIIAKDQNELCQLLSDSCRGVICINILLNVNIIFITIIIIMIMIMIIILNFVAFHQNEFHQFSVDS